MSGSTVNPYYCVEHKVRYDLCCARCEERFCSGCQEIDAAEIDRARWTCWDCSAKAKENLRALEERLLSIPRRHREGVEGFREQSPRLADAVDRWSEHFTPFQAGLFIYGKWGRGKSHVAFAIARALLEEGFTFHWWGTTDLLLELRATIEKKGATECDVYHKAAGCDLIILDDLGTENRSAFAERSIFALINHLYERKTTLIVTSNLDFEQLKKAWEPLQGARLVSRLREMCDPFHMDGPDFRKIIGDERRAAKGSDNV